MIVIDTAFCHRMEEKNTSLTQNESSLQNFSFLMSLISQKHMVEKKKRKRRKTIRGDFVWAQKWRGLDVACVSYSDRKMFATELAEFHKSFLP